MAFEMNPEAGIGHVHLNVVDRVKAVRFYRDLLGLRSSGKASDASEFLTVQGDEEPILALSGAHGAVPSAVTLGGQRHAGLYHFAILLPDRKHLANLYRRLAAHRSEFYFEGSADHLVSESLYVRDPESNGIELTVDRNPSQWKRTASHIQMDTLPLDLKGLLEGGEPREWGGMPAGTTVGHVHLHVTSIDRSLEFYSKLLGLHPTAHLPGAHFLAAGEYHHHVAVNSWLGEFLQPAEDGAPGMDHFAIRLPNRRQLEGLVDHLTWQGAPVKRIDEEPFGQTFRVRDPDGIWVQLYSH